MEEIIKSRGDINEIEIKKTSIKSSFFEKINKTDTP